MRYGTRNEAWGMRTHYVRKFLKIETKLNQNKQMGNERPTMTQKEFDDKMNELRRRQTDESMPLRLEVESLNARRRAIGCEMAALQGQLSALTARRDALELRLKDIGAHYYQLKKELIVSNPKTGQATAEGGGACDEGQS